VRIDSLIADPNAQWAKLKPHRGDQGGPSNYAVKDGFIRANGVPALDEHKEPIAPSAVVNAMKSQATTINAMDRSKTAPSARSPLDRTATHPTTTQEPRKASTDAQPATTIWPIVVVAVIAAGLLWLVVKWRAK
jgi:hypothetical protein